VWVALLPIVPTADTDGTRPRFRGLSEVTLSITLAAPGNSISGSWEVVFGTCAGANGPFDVRGR
jgi:hypothetical protein